MNTTHRIACFLACGIDECSPPALKFGNCCTVPVEYFCPLDENGRRRDADERPELSCGSVEFVAPTEYMVRPPMPPVYFFLIDVSVSAVKSGMLKVHNIFPWDLSLKIIIISRTYNE